MRLPISSVAVTADGSRAVSGGVDGTVRVWNLATGHQAAELTRHSGGTWAVAVTADGSRAVSGSEDGTVRAWDLATGRQQAKRHCCVGRSWTLVGWLHLVRARSLLASGSRAR